MREYGFSLTRILPYKDKAYDFVLIQENRGKWKPLFSHIWFSVSIYQQGSIADIRKSAIMAWEKRAESTS